MGLAATTLPALTQGRNQRQSTSQRSLSLPELEENWADYQSISSPPDGRYDWTGVITQRTDLKQKLARYAEQTPAVASYFAAKVSFPDNLRSLESRTSVDITGDGGLFSIRVDRLGELMKKRTCGLDPHHSEVRAFGHDLFIKQMVDMHHIEKDPTIEEGLRKDISPNCLNTRSYSKTRYLDYQYTFESEWEAGDSDEINDISFKGYLSIEFGTSEYLLVGGMVPDEELSTELVDENIVSNEARLANVLVDLMEQTTLR